MIGVLSKNHALDHFSGFAEALETKEEIFFFKEKKENANFSIAAILNVTRAFSAPILFFLRCFCGTKKREKGIVVLVFVVYGRLLVTSIASTAIPTIITIMIAITPYINVVCDAIPLSGVAVGAAVGAEAPA